MELVRARLGPRLAAVWLYGSRARGEPPREESDVDLLVLVHDHSRYVYVTIDGLLFEAADAVAGRPYFFSLHVHDVAWPDERRAVDSFFMREIDRDKVVIHGEP